MQYVTLTVTHVVTTTDRDGDSTSASTTTEVPRVVFEPAQPVERTDSRAPGVATPAKFYAPVALELDADDEVVCNGVRWAVVGGSSVWGPDATEIPVRRVGEV